MNLTAAFARTRGGEAIHSAGNVGRGIGEEQLFGFCGDALIHDRNFRRPSPLVSMRRQGWTRITDAYAVTLCSFCNTEVRFLIALACCGLTVNARS